MPRIVFRATTDLEDWASKLAAPSRYNVYATERQEIILEPLRSTSPVRYGYLKMETSNMFSAFVNDLKSRGYNVFPCASYDWSSDRAVGSGAPLESE